MSHCWAVPVPLLPDELFSSWLARAAIAQGCDPLILTGTLWPRWRIWACDADRGLSDERAFALAEMSGIGVSTFEAASLRPTVAAIASGPLDSLAIWPWTLALGSRNRRRHGGLQCCPVCLQEDHIPYYRLRWRLAWHTGCAAHGVRLLDRCPSCNAPLEPHRLLATDATMAVCATCKHDLRGSATVAHARAALAFQHAADNVLTHGQGTYGADWHSAGRWLELSRYFVMLLRKAVRSESSRLAAFAKTLGVDVENMQPSATGLALELLPVEERTMFLAGAWGMLAAGSESFLAAATAASLPRSTLSERRHPAPEPVASLIEALPGNYRSRTRATHSDAPTPRSRQTVMRMFARLQRKIPVAAR